MTISDKQIIKLIGQTKKISPSDLKTAEKRAKHLNCSIVDILCGQGSLSEDDIGRLYAEHYDLQFINLTKTNITSQILTLIPEILAADRRVIAFDRNDNNISLAMEDPQDLGLIELVKKTIGPKTIITPFITTKNCINHALRYYNIYKQKQDDVAHVTDSANQSAIAIIEDLLEQALKETASDIHIEATASEVLVRLRVDGVLHDKLFLPKQLHSPLVARIKVLCDLKLDEHRLPQDGNFSYKLRRGDKISLRVSTLPTVWGEKVVLRILQDSLTKFNLSELGLCMDHQTIIERNLSKPQGMILLTGPTGSGKTTSLYTMLGLVNKPGVNIITVEDPVENRIRRINQIQVNQAIGLTFANGLRSILRQDPDIIMIGEIRDRETAVIAVNSAMTGHTVLSSVHANSASGTIPRMIDLGAEPFLVASTLNIVIAQRLVRIICSKCASEEPVSPLLKDQLRQYQNEMSAPASKIPKKTLVAKGCAECNFVGYRGRTGIFEIIEIDEKIKKMIMNKQSASQIAQYTREKGIVSMIEDGINKVINKTTSLEEILRVVAQ